MGEKRKKEGKLGFQVGLALDMQMSLADQAEEEQGGQVWCEERDKKS